MYVCRLYEKRLRCRSTTTHILCCACRSKSTSCFFRMLLYMTDASVIDSTDLTDLTEVFGCSEISKAILRTSRSARGCRQSVIVFKQAAAASDSKRAPATASSLRTERRRMSFGMSESLLPPEIAYKIEEVVPVFGPMISGAVFGGAWWIWCEPRGFRARERASERQLRRQASSRA